MVLGVDKKTKFYEGENKFKPVFDFLNIYSETFYKVGEDKVNPSDQTTTQSKPWLNERLPELTKESGNDICFKVDGVVCVILINKEKPNEDLVNIINNLQNYLSPKIDRGGVKYKFGWISSSIQKNFISAVEEEESCGPKLMLVNPAKRKRFYIMDNDLTEENMSKLY